MDVSRWRPSSLKVPSCSWNSKLNGTLPSTAAMTTTTGRTVIEPTFSSEPLTSARGAAESMTKSFGELNGVRLAACTARGGKRNTPSQQQKNKNTKKKKHKHT